MAKVRLNGKDKGTFPVKIRQPQSTLSATIDFTESQQSWVGEDCPFAVLPVMKFKHGVKLVIIEAVQGVLIWPFIL